jgi:DNA-binding MarR family transcriptional regulator
MTDPLDSRVAGIRAFNRFWTARIGVLDDTHLGTPFSLAEARVLFELAQRAGDGPTEVSALKGELALDAGYLSRMLTALRARKVVVVGAKETDARCRVVRLTAAGRTAARSLDTRARSQVGALLAPLDDTDQRRVLDALGAVRDLLDPSEPRATAVALRAPRSGDFGWIVERHGALYEHEYGWDVRFEGLCASIVADYVAARGPRVACWIAEVDGERAGCIFCTQKDAKTAQLRLLLVEPRFRGLGIGARLVDECVAFARAKGYRTMMLWTNDNLVAARRLYERAGFVLIASKKHTMFGPRLTSQTWELVLRSDARRSRARRSRKR